MENLMKFLPFFFASLLSCFITPLSFAGSSQALMQFSVLKALVHGLYDGEMTFAELKKYGNFGLGTFDQLDGEMIALNGKFYQILSDGEVIPVSPKMTTPFSTVTFFKPERTLTPPASLSLQQLEAYISKQTLLNSIYAIQIEGTFSHVKTRVVPKQEKPYLPLASIAAKQPTFEFLQVKGKMIGFKLPPYLDGINVGGYHLHFISDDEKHGGHVLECTLSQGKILLDEIPQFLMVLPKGAPFAEKDLSQDVSKEIQAIEKERHPLK